MEQGLCRLNDDIILSKIERKMDIVFTRELSSYQASKVISEIEQLLKKMTPESQQKHQMYFEMFKDKVARLYLLGGPIMEK